VDLQGSYTLCTVEEKTKGPFYIFPWIEIMNVVFLSQKPDTELIHLKLKCRNSFKKLDL